MGKNAHKLFVPQEVRAESREAISGFFRNEAAYEVMRPIVTKKGVVAMPHGTDARQAA